jgi:hypothetical protein
MTILLLLVAKKERGRVQKNQKSLRELRELDAALKVVEGAKLNNKINKICYYYIMSRNLSKYLESITNLDNFEYRDDNGKTRRDKKAAFLQYIRDNNLIYTEVWDNVPVGTPYIHINFAPGNKTLVCPEEFPQTKESNKYIDLNNYDEDGYIMLNPSRGSSMSYARGRRSKRSNKSKSAKKSRKSRKSKRTRRSKK